MLPEKVDQMLKNYREYLGRCKYLEIKIAQLEKEVEWLTDQGQQTW